jgi:DNA polymerase/3'-5' exonuclease PolX
MNNAIIDALQVLYKQERMNKEPFKAKAYSVVITNIKNHGAPITSIDDLKDIKGVGKKIFDKIKEIIETGTLKRAEETKEADEFKAYDVFQKIHGVGPVKARSLIERGITNIAQLRARIVDEPNTLNDTQKMGLMYYEDLLERIPRAEMERHNAILKSAIPNCELVGSFRRGLETSGDIDVLIPYVEGGVSLKAYVKALISQGYITDILALGDKKCMAVCTAGHGDHRRSGLSSGIAAVGHHGCKARRLDLLLTPKHEYAYALLYFTGSEQFNIAFRSCAISQGYTLNEHKMTRINTEIPIKPVPEMVSEKDIFDFLGLQYMAPTLRIIGKVVRVDDM